MKRLMSPGLRFVAVVFILLTAGVAIGQESRDDRGGRGNDRNRDDRNRRDRDEGDRDEGDRGDRGRGFGGPGFEGGGPGFGGPGFGGPGFGGQGGGPGGGFGGRGGFGGGPQDFLRRMDRNGNGMLDPDETEAARPFLERIARQVPQIDFRRPVSIERLSEAMERMRQDRFGEGGRGDDDDEGSSTSSESASLVPGFGSDIELAPVPGFGADAELFTVEIEDRDRRAAQDRMRRYDRNNDGVLSSDELARGRWGDDDPLRYDRNKDGRLTLDEMAFRYAQRRLADGDERGGNAKNEQKFYIPGGSTASSSTGSGPRDPEAEERMGRFADITISRYDRNRNGKLEREEYENMPNDPSAADRNRDGVIDRGELAAWLARGGFGGGWGGRGGSEGGRGDGEGRGFGRGRGGDFGGGGWGGRGGGDFAGGGGFGGDGERRFYSDGEGESAPQSAGEQKNGDRQLFRNASATDRLKASGLQEDLPDWFLRDDQDQDGQVSMAEFSASWSDAVVADFRKFDLNDDGVITAKECVAAAKNGARRGGSDAGPARGSRGTASNSGSSSPSATASSNSSSGRNASPPTTTASGSTSSGSTSSSSSAPAAPANLDARYAAYAANIINKYDKNGDGELDESEWSAMSNFPASADTDMNGKVTVEELARSYMKSP